MQGKRLASIAVLCLALIAIGSPASAQVTYSANFLTQNGVNYLCAENGGGTSFADVLVADRTSPGPWETFGLEDTDGGSLLDGDHVILRTYNNTIVGGWCGGPTNSVHTSGSAGCQLGSQWYHFWIYKVGGSGGSTIASGDQVILEYSNFYTIIADWGGGSTVRLAGSWGPDETFTIFY